MYEIKKKFINGYIIVLDKWDLFDEIHFDVLVILHNLNNNLLNSGNLHFNLKKYMFHVMRHEWESK